MEKWMVWLLVLGLALPGAACGGGGEEAADGGAAEAMATSPDSPGSDAVVVEERAGPTEAEEPEPEPEDAEVGTHDSPVPLAASPDDAMAVRIGDWVVAVAGVDTDAADMVAAENQFNDPPAAGHQFVMVTLGAQYDGDDTGNFWIDMSYKVLGNGGNTFGESCGVIPNSITDSGETFPGGTVAGNLCFSVPADQIDGAQLILEQSFSFSDASRVFFALQ